jgi:Inhibitor of Apoptosis domain
LLPFNCHPWTAATSAAAECCNRHRVPSPDCRRHNMQITYAVFLTVRDEINNHISYIARTRGERYASNLLERVETFDDFENALFYASAGFSATRFEDVICCDDCTLHFTNIESTDCLLYMHKYFSPDCNFVKDLILTEEMKTYDFLEMCHRCKM